MSGTKPADFDSYWQATLDQLAQLPAAPEVAEIPLRSTDFATAYGVRLTSIGPYRIYGYLSIPVGDGPFPAKYFLPRYGSVVDLVPQGTANGQRQQYVTFSICVARPAAGGPTVRGEFPGAPDRRNLRPRNLRVPRDRGGLLPRRGIFGQPT